MNMKITQNVLKEVPKSNNYNNKNSKKQQKEKNTEHKYFYLSVK